MVNQLAMAIINGILLGGVYALLAYGLNLIFGVIKIIHLAYGQFIMLAIYIIYTCNVMLDINIIISILITLIAMGFVGYITQYVVINPLINAPRVNQLLALAALILIIENFTMVVWGANYRSISIFLPVLSFKGLYIRASYLLAFVGSLITLYILHTFLNKTYIGLAIRSVAQDEEMAKQLGINAKFIYYVTLAIGGVLTGIVAAFFVPIYTVNPHFGTSFTIMAFVIVVLGGMGNLFGGFVAAFIIGIITSLSSTIFSTEIADIVVYTIFIMVMFYRPQGIFSYK